jgi:hypothetical protein
MGGGITPNALEIGVLQEDTFMEPPEGSTSEFEREWYQIVEDFPPTWFRPSDRPVLTEYIRTKIMLDQLHAQVNALGSDWTYLDKNNLPRPHPLLNVLTKTQQNFKMLASTLRASPSARRAEVPKSPRRSRTPNKELENLLGPLAGMI